MSDHASPDEPAWWHLAAKAVTSALVAFTVAGGTLLAALADDHVTTTEWVTFGIALAGALVGPYSVYRTTNAQEPAKFVVDIPARPAAPYRAPEHLGHLPMHPDDWRAP